MPSKMTASLQLSADHNAQSARYEEAKAQAAELARHLSTAQERSQKLGVECQACSAALEATQQRLRDALAAQTTSCQQWESQQAALQVLRSLHWRQATRTGAKHFSRESEGFPEQA